MAKEEIVDIQMEEEKTIETVNSKEALERRLKQRDNNTLKTNWRLAESSPAREMDTEIKEAERTTQGLAESKHTVKKLTEEEMERMVKEISLEEERVEDNNKVMEEEEEEGRSNLFNTP